MEALWRIAQALARAAAQRNPKVRRLPPLLFFTDPSRIADPAAAAHRLPSGAGVVFRHFGRSDRLEVGRALAHAARKRGLTLLVGDDEALAAALDADGVHLPERRLGDAPRLIARQPSWLVTAAAHSARALHKAAGAGVDAAVLSPVLPSRSPSAGRPLGSCRTADLIRRARLPVYALGGVSTRTAPRLLGTRACGLAAVGAIDA